MAGRAVVRRLVPTSTVLMLVLAPVLQICTLLLLTGCGGRGDGDAHSTAPAGLRYHAVMRISNALDGTRLPGVEGCTILAEGTHLCQASSENGYVTFIHFFPAGSEPTTTTATAAAPGFQTWSGHISWAPGYPASAITGVSMTPVGATPPSLRYSPDRLVFRDGDGPAVVRVWNGGDGSLEWEVDLLTTFWVGAVPTEGVSTGETDDIVVTVDWSRFWPGQTERSTNLSVITRLGRAEIPISASVQAEEPQIVTGTTVATGEFSYYSRHRQGEVTVKVLDEHGAPLSNIRIDAYHTGATEVVLARDENGAYYPNVFVRPARDAQGTHGTARCETVIEPITIILGAIVLANTIHWLMSDPPSIEVMMSDSGIVTVCVCGDLEDVVNTAGLLSFGAGTFLHIGTTVAAKLGLSSTFAQMVDATAFEWMRELIDMGFVMDADYTICQLFLAGSPMSILWIPDVEVQSGGLPEIVTAEATLLSAEPVGGDIYQADFDVTARVTGGEEVHRVWLYVNGSAAGTGDMNNAGDGVFVRSVRGATVIKDGMGSGEEGEVRLYMLVSGEEKCVDTMGLDLF